MPSLLPLIVESLPDVVIGLKLPASSRTISGLHAGINRFLPLSPSHIGVVLVALGLVNEEMGIFWAGTLLFMIGHVARARATLAGNVADESNSGRGQTFVRPNPLATADVCSVREGWCLHDVHQ
jgi:hypothetical protein